MDFPTSNRFQHQNRTDSDLFAFNALLRKSTRKLASANEFNRIDGWRKNNMFSVPYPAVRKENSNVG